MAQIPSTPPEKVRRIKNAKPDETAEALAEELGVSIRTVKKYRAEGRRERAEVAREVVRLQVEDAAPSAVTALTRTMQIASEQMETTKQPVWVRETRESATAVLKHLGLQPEKDPLEGVDSQALVEEALRRIGRVPQ